MYAYGLKGAPAVGGGLPGLPRRGERGSQDLRGSALFPIPGMHEWIVPKGVRSISMVCVGAGGGSRATSLTISGGGGALAWKNSVPVSPGDTVEIVVGKGGASNVPGGDSYVKVNGETVCHAGGGAPSVGGGQPAGGQVIEGDGGGQGGDGATDTAPAGAASGGAAGGYSGPGAGAAWGNALGNDAPPGGGGGSGATATGAGGYAGASGGVGLFGEGESGEGGKSAAGNRHGRGGSGGQGGDGDSTTIQPPVAGKFGAGGSAKSSTEYTVQRGADGGVRIVWGRGRSFPSTDVGYD